MLWNQGSMDNSSQILKVQNNWTFNPNEPDSDKRYNAKDIDGLHFL